MKKETKKLFEREEIVSRGEAERIIEKRKTQTILGYAGLGVAAVTSVFSVILISKYGAENFLDHCGIPLVGALIAYILCGGIGKAFRFMFNTGATFWNFTPFYPVCFLTYVIGLLVGFGVLAGLPIVFTLGSFLAKKREYEDAMLYLSGSVATY